MAIAPRDEVTVSGPDALSYLQGQVSQDLLPMDVGEERWTFLLAPNGRPIAGSAVLDPTLDAGELERMRRVNRARLRADADGRLFATQWLALGATEPAALLQIVLG